MSHVKCPAAGCPECEKPCEGPEDPRLAAEARLASSALPRNEAGEIVLARADYEGVTYIGGWTCTDCRVEFRSLYGILRHLAYGGDRRVVVDVLEGEITRKEG